MIDVDGYLRRLRLSAGKPSVDGLFALQQAHVERVPYETLPIWLGRPTSVDPAESAARIVAGRGGYCFHLNGALSELLSALGYSVTRHFGGVQGSAADSAGARGNHLVLTVDGLPTDENPSGEWLVDAGLGDAIHSPIPLIEGVYDQGPFTYRLRPSEAEPGGWRLDHDPRGSFVGMDFRKAPTEMSAFESEHVRLSTSPESGFVRVFSIQRRDATGVDVARGLVLTRIGHDSTSTTLDRETDYFAALADVFDLHPTAEERAILWPQLTVSHEKWLATSYDL
ncbi:arylamine N-acetyltransferase [Herbidospora sp. NEAU-GS84]|uniref:Arylamine N-acetyltransferase n=1 Tax=Herbidospora solisilvae TaxID=2696284 RepID=A0A7C9NJQ3_9ACTN|nr:arylamine N-acetyltransferase [Herbidospora solisilvae]NAS24332.1 arylamine N-acetyltransferase [Herbidospora solisilvae]